jgi:hypothetical protein
MTENKAMTLQGALHLLRSSEPISGSARKSMADAIDAHLSQPAQAVDVGAIREVISRLRAFHGYSPMSSFTRSELDKEIDKLTRALSTAQAEVRGVEGWKLVPITATEQMLEAGRSAVMARECSGPNWGPADHYKAAGISREGIPDRLFDGKGKMSKAWGAELVYAAMIAATPAPDKEGK